METDLIILVIDDIHRKASLDLESKDVLAYSSIFDEALTYRYADGKVADKQQYLIDLKKYFKGIKKLNISQYRIKFSFENEIFTEKIASKLVIIKTNFLMFSKKETIQIEESFHWKNINGEWKAIAVEVVLEEKY